MAESLAHKIRRWMARYFYHEVLMEGSISDIAAAMKKKRVVTISRDNSSKDGTFGVLRADFFQCYTLEPEWLNNERGFSCIPDGEYECEIVDSPKYGRVYGLKTSHINRDNVLTHWGNFAATAPGKTNTEGCVLLGRAIGEIAKQRALLSSRDAFTAFMAEMDSEPFVLKIEWREPADV